MNFFRAFTSAALLLAGAGAAQANGIGYISSASGYMLHMSGSTAVTADWRGQKPIDGFSGYGQIKMNNLCLTGSTGGQPLTWLRCADMPAQRWKLKDGQLNNEGGWCADVEGSRNGAGVRVVAWNCTKANNQKWRSHPLVPASAVALQIKDPVVRETFQRNSIVAKPGDVLSTVTGEKVASGGNMVAAGGGNMVAAGGGNMVAAGGGN